MRSKKISKTQAVTSQFDVPLEPDNIHVGPSDYVPWLSDQKMAYIRLEGTAFGGAPLSAELKLDVWDSPNSAGVVIDAVRCAKLALDCGLADALVGPSSYFMKSPPEQFTDDEARGRTCGRMPGVQLDELGCRQMAAVAEAIVLVGPLAVQSSPQQRALQSANIVATRCCLALEIAPGFDEIDMGQWTGIRFADLESDKTWQQWNEKRSRIRPPGRESMAALQRR